MTEKQDSLLYGNIAWLMILLSPLFAAASELPNTVDTIRPSIVAIGTIMPTRSPKAQFMGTGFVVGDGRHIITNHHVIPKIVDYARRETLAIFQGRGKQAKGRKATVVATDAVHDLALLAITGEPLPALKLGDSATVREGELYAFTGFPIGMVLGLYPVTHRGIVSAITPIVIPALNSRQLEVKHIRRMKNPFNVFQLDATAYPGNSGSPLYSIDTGQVLGVVNSVLVKNTKESALTNPTGISYAIPVKYVHRLLNR
ncbi:MAG: serine protease [Candidatus Polarisedimenticolaceae bacterium]|nr:serine protease [Candidatus Polarisedimenticolaceae bacterium]